MPHETPLISTIVVAFVLAFILGAIANRLRLPPLVGYLIAGVVVGPYSPGFVADQEIANELSEIGVILLMFGVGLNFSLEDLLRVQAVAIPGALGRIVLGTGMGVGLAWLFGWPLFGGLIFGLALSVASTVVLLKALQDRHLMDSERGRIAIGWVIVEDVAMVLALVLIPAFAPAFGGDTSALASDPFVSMVERLLRTDLNLWGVIAVTVIKLAAFVGFMLVVGKRLIPMVLHFTAHTGSRELFRLAVLAIALGVAVGSAYLFGVSLALGAFFAGMILSESQLSQRAAQETLPLRDAFAVLFFVAVGMLFDPNIFLTNPLGIIGALFIVLVGKTVVAFFLMVLFRQPVGSALTISASLAQIGEFSFILAALGMSLKLLPEAGQDLILAAAIVSIILNPLMFWLADLVRPMIEARFTEAKVEPSLGEVVMEPGAPRPPSPPAPAVEEEPQHQTTLNNHTVLIGYGRVGSVIGAGLLKEGRPFVLIEDGEGRVAAARAAGIEVIDENAATSRAMQLANVRGADTVIVAIPNAFEAGQATEQSRRLNPEARIIVRAHSDEEESHLMHLGATSVVMGEREIGMGMLDILRGGPPRPAATAASLEHALGKALAQPLAPLPPLPDQPQREVGPEETASIEAALGRALSLEPAADAVPPTEPVISPEAAADIAEATAAPVEAPATADLPADAAPPEPVAAPAVDEDWMHTPAIDPAEESVPVTEPAAAPDTATPTSEASTPLTDVPPAPAPEQPIPAPQPVEPPTPAPEAPPPAPEPAEPPRPAEAPPGAPPQELPPAPPVEDPWSDPPKTEPEIPVPAPEPAEPPQPREAPPAEVPTELPGDTPAEIPSGTTATSPAKP